MPIFRLSFGALAATVDSDNGLIRLTVEGNQATAVKRVECLSLAQLNTLPSPPDGVIQARV